IPNEFDIPSTGNISQLSARPELPQLEHSSTQAQGGKSLDSSKSPTEPESFATSLPEEIIDDDSAETLDFVETLYKENVSNEIMERTRKKKFQNQEVSSGKQDTFSEESVQNISEKSIGNSASTYVPSLMSEVVQGLLQEFSVNSIEGKNIEFINNEPSNSAPVELAHLLYQASKARKKSIKAKQEEILSWGCYSEKYEDRVIKITSENKNLKDKTARTQIYNEMKPYLTGISDEYLRKIT
ncbi:4346_t:CDS:1, partial [Racocetra fulgida]